MKNKKITICHTSDMHGYIMPYSYANNEDTPIGVSKIAAITNTLKNKILIDTGDFLQGSALATFNARSGNSLIFSDVLNRVGYDYFVPGNHDFNYGEEYLTSFTDSLDATVLSANIYKSKRVFKPYDIIEFEDGPKIAIIGLTTHFIPNWENPKNIQDFTFKHELEELDEILQTLPEVDYKIVAYHGGFNKDLATDQLVPNETGENSGSDMFYKNINCLLTGHQHQRVAGRKNGIIYSQPGSNGNQLNVIELDFYYEDGWKVKDTISQIEVDEEYDTSITELIKQQEQKTQEWLDTPIGSLANGDCFITDPLDARLNKSSLVTLINQAQLELTGADISCTSLGNDVAGFSQSITTRDIVSTYIYPNTLVVLEVSGKTIKQALEKCAEFFTVDNGIQINPEYLSPKRELYNYDMYDGIEYTINLSNPIGKRITSITKDGSPLNKKQNYTLVMNNYRAAGGGNFTMFKNQTVVKSIEKDMVEILSNFIETKKVIKLNDNNNITITY